MPKQYDPEARIESQEKKRIEAFNSRNAALYTRLCDELGITPEDELLYERGLLIIDEENKVIEFLVQEAEGSFIQEAEQQADSADYRIVQLDRNVREFIRESGSMGALNDYVLNSEAKRASLQAHFQRFRREGKPDISNWPEEKVGALYQRVCRSYEKKYGRETIAEIIRCRGQ